jgi:hypothetical protein
MSDSDDLTSYETLGPNKTHEKSIQELVQELIQQLRNDTYNEAFRMIDYHANDLHFNLCKDGNKISLDIKDKYKPCITPDIFDSVNLLYALYPDNWINQCRLLARALQNLQNKYLKHKMDIYKKNNIPTASIFIETSNENILWFQTREDNIVLQTIQHKYSTSPFMWACYYSEDMYIQLDGKYLVFGYNDSMAYMTNDKDTNSIIIAILKETMTTKINTFNSNSSKSSSGSNNNNTELINIKIKF